MYLIFLIDLISILIDLVNIWSIFGHVLGNWAQGLAWGGDLVCHAAWTPPGHYYGMQSTRSGGSSVPPENLLECGPREARSL